VLSSLARAGRLPACPADFSRSIVAGLKQISMIDEEGNVLEDPR
jgi:hypothetical protein